MPRDFHIEDQIHNFTPGRVLEYPRLIVIHSTRGGAATPELECQATINWFKNPASEVSAHLVIAHNGDWYYCVPWTDTAWHAGYLNDRSIGIELVQQTAATPFTDIQVSRLVDAVKWLCDTYHIPKVRVWDEDYPGIIGHEDTLQGKAHGKSDPGPMFDWDAFMVQLTVEPLTPVSVSAEWMQRALDAEAKLEAIRQAGGW